MVTNKIFHESGKGIILSPEFIRLAIMLAVISLIYAFPVITTDRLYIDDLRRSVLGIAEWEGVGRPIASILMALINFQYPDFHNLRIIDLSPLLQIMALGLLVIAAASLSFSINGQKASWLNALSVFPIIGSPFYLENLSYHFDSLPMAAAMALAIITALPQKSNSINILAGSIGVALILGLYQPCINVFLGVTLLVLLTRMTNGHSVGPSFLIANSIKLLIGYGIYKALIFPLYPLIGYMQPHVTLIPRASKGISLAINNIGSVFEVLKACFLPFPSLIIFSLAAYLLILINAIIQPNASESEKEFTYVRMCLIVIAPLLFILLIPGASIILSSPVIAPRTLVGFSIFLAFIFWAFIRGTDAFKSARLLLLIPTGFMLFISYGFAAANRSQSDYDKHLVSSLKYDLHASGLRKTSTLLITGRQPISPILHNSARIHLINLLVPIYMNGDWEWGYRFLNQNGLEFRRYNSGRDSLLRQMCASLPVIIKPDYTIYKDNDIFIASFDGGTCKP